MKCHHLVEMTTKLVEVTTKLVEMAAKRVEMAAKQVEMISKRVEKAAKQVETTTKRVETTTKQVEMATKQVESPTKQVEMISKRVEMAAKLILTISAKFRCAEMSNGPIAPSHAPPRSSHQSINVPPITLGWASSALRTQHRRNEIRLRALGVFFRRGEVLGKLRHPFRREP
jgi:hypothetical protein